MNKDSIIGMVIGLAFSTLAIEIIMPISWRSVLLIAAHLLILIALQIFWFVKRYHKN